MEPIKRPRLKDIAARVGVSTMLVSIALRGMPGVAEATRRKIKACAKQLGYHPDPALSALADYRRRSRPVASFAQIAFVTDFPKEQGLGSAYTYDFLSGAQKRGLEFGYEVTPFWLREGGLTHRQASSVLFNRGIKGLVIAPLPVESGQLDLTWKCFCAVAIGNSLTSPLLDYAAFDHHKAMQAVLERLHERGYQRIGLFLIYRSSERLRYAPLDAYMGEQHRRPPEFPLPPLLTDGMDSGEFWHWFDSYKPDVIITDAYAGIIDLLKQRGLRAPADVGVACFSRFIKENIEISSVTQDLEAIGAAAIDRLHTNLLRSAYGVPEHSYGTLLHGHWAEGTTLKKRAGRTQKLTA
ncbi:LacI family DNA-binding transcriptional regulator [Rariglobus hedericola]|uniref:LacI family transcriptional regulator n=1 Tax=Rariglobus hedericola TaxID=2597822 RepID=A0A556QL36_9BACT|nr:LacI family DNA-binding transcriptional regulator [Rariglobus hedericola]TSJ77321.1 LacI family transcriptional regulator [Rariglobus hedericola]